MKTNYFNAYTQALGALKLIPIFLNCPGVISRATLIGASTEAVQLLELSLIHISEPTRPY